MSTDTMPPVSTGDAGLEAKLAATEHAFKESQVNFAAITAMATRMADLTDMDEAVATALEIARENFEWEYASFWRYDKTQDELKFGFDSGSVSAEFAAVTAEATFAKGVGLAGRAWQRNELVFVPDLGEVADCVRASVAKRSDVKSGIAMPLHVHGQILGTIDFFATKEITLSPTRMGVLQGLARILSSLLTRLRDRQLDKERETCVVATNAVATALSSSKRGDDAVKLAIDHVRQEFGWAYSSFWKIDPKDQVLKFCVDSGDVDAGFRQVTEAATFEKGVGLAGKTWQRGELVFVEDIAEMTDCCRAPEAKRCGVGSGVCMPIYQQGEIVGTMDFFVLGKIELSEVRLHALKEVGRMVSVQLDLLEQKRLADRGRAIAESTTANMMLANTDLELVWVSDGNLRAEAVTKAVQVPMYLAKVFPVSLQGSAGGGSKQEKLMH
ncbi:MAG: GAF domain-containing protein, partial [Planctomycetota bacterium]